MTSHIRSIAVVNAYVRENAGDAALLSVCLDQVRTAIPGASVIVAGMESPTERTEFEGAPNIGSIRRYVAEGSVPRSRRIVRRAGVGISLLGYLAMPSSIRGCLRARWPGEVGAELRAVAESDLVVSTGGGYVQAAPGINGYQNLYFVLLPLVIALREGRRVALMPQSYGPFRSAPQRWITRRVTSRANLVCARESISVQALESCRVAPEQIRLVADSAFAFRSRPVPGDSISGIPLAKGLHIGVTARSWLAGDDQRHYEQALAGVIDWLTDQGHHVVLIPQVTTGYLGDDDRTVNARIAAFCRSEPQVRLDAAEAHDRASAYGALDLLIGTRFHSVIFALTAYVPCIAIAYEHKTRGIMRRLGLEEWVVDIDAVTAEGSILPLVQRVLSERAEYAELLRATVPDIVADADRVTTWLADLAGAT